MKVSIDRIKIKKRIRSDLGDLHQLKESMRKNGLINPISVSRDFELLAGYRRLQAAKELGWQDIECKLLNVKTKLQKFEVETDENIHRRDFSPEEMELIAARREELSARGLKWLWLIIKRWLRALRKAMNGKE